jgi:prepilin-type N-terminal cleavage/methylation domain-containing protein
MICAHPLRPGNRSGYSLVELLIVLMIAALVLSLAMPKMVSFTRYLTARSATSQVVGDLALTRSTAVREGRATSLRVLTASSYAVVVDAQGTTAARTVKSVTVDGASRGVSLGTVGTRITFDSRGMRRDATQSLIVTRAGGADTVTVTIVGRVYRGSGN